MKDRGERRHQAEKMKDRARALWRRWNPRVIRIENGKVVERSQTEAPAKWVGTMASTHLKPCSCNMCGNPRHFAKGGDSFEQLTMQERRAMQDSVYKLERDESIEQIRREVDATECDDPSCDCH